LKRPNIQISSLNREVSRDQNRLRTRYRQPLWAVGLEPYTLRRK